MKIERCCRQPDTEEHDMVGQDGELIPMLPSLLAVFLWGSSGREAVLTVKTLAVDALISSSLGGADMS